VKTVCGGASRPGERFLNISSGNISFTNIIIICYQIVGILVSGDIRFYIDIA
jgi:hypothetical protein